MRFTGQCRCGKVHIRIKAETLPPLYACHCLNCQRWSGSAFALHLLCAAQAVEVLGDVLTYGLEDEGQTSTQYACASCFTRMFNETTAAPGTRIVRAGTLEEIGQLAPVAHIWVKRKQPWLSLPEGVAQWPETPTPEEFVSILRG